MVLVASMAVPTGAAGHEDREVHELEDKYFVVRTHVSPGDGIRTVGDAVCELIYERCLDPTYQTVAMVEIWEESNGCENLQREPGDCDDDGEIEDNDKSIAFVGCSGHGSSPCGTPDLF